TGRGKRFLRLTGLDRVPQQRSCAGMQGFGRIRVVADYGQGKGTLRRLPFPGSVGKQSGFGLLVPVDDDDLKGLVGDSFDGGDGVGTELSLNSEIGQNRAKDRGRSLVRGKQEAANRHASSE